MTYKSKQTWKDLIDKPLHRTLSRREMLAAGMATGLLSVLPQRVYGQNLTCPPTTKSLGAIAQIYAQGGPTMGARFIGEDQAGMMNPTMAANYGITGTNLLRLGPNLVIDTTSPFGATIMQGPTGFPGGSAGWQTTVLNKISAGGHRGPFNMDDGAGQNIGLLGGSSAFKASQMSKDLRIGVGSKVANWAAGLSAVSTSRNGLTGATLSRLFTVTPAATGLTNAQAMTDASNGAVSLANALAPTFNNANRNGHSQMVTSAGCAFYGNSTLADPAFGASLFTPANIPALNATLTAASLNAAEQALLASYYQSANGTIGGVILELGGRDYHGQNVQNNITPADIEEARAIVMFLAACHAAQAPGAFLYFSNGQAIASGVQNVPATIGGVATTVNGPVARGDAGGSYNAGLIIFYSPTGSFPTANMTGTITASNGNARTASGIGSPQSAVAGLYLSALKFINGGNIPASALTAMGISNPAGLVVF